MKRKRTRQITGPRVSGQFRSACNFRTKLAEGRQTFWEFANLKCKLSHQIPTYDEPYLGREFAIT